MKRLLLLIALFCLPASAQAPTEEINTLLMHATFKIIGPSATKEGKASFGTVFLMARPLRNDPGHGSAVLITAAHVLESIRGDVATLVLRRRDSDGVYTAFTHEVTIRKAGTPLYTKHDTADVAAMYVDLPTGLPITGLPPSVLAEDQRIDELEIHPGDQVFYLGFPLAGNGPGGFPLLRAGLLASYPLTPVIRVQRWVIDGLLYGGNSGGPVYFYYPNRFYKGQLHLGYAQGVLGLVIESSSSPIPEFADKPLNYGAIVPALFIRETIDKLPAKK